MCMGRAELGEIARPFGPEEDHDPERAGATACTPTSLGSAASRNGSLAAFHDACIAAAVITLIAASVYAFLDDRLAAATFGAKHPASTAP